MIDTGVLHLGDTHTEAVWVGYGHTARGWRKRHQEPRVYPHLHHTVQGEVWHQNYNARMYCIIIICYIFKCLV